MSSKVRLRKHKVKVPYELVETSPSPLEYLYQVITFLPKDLINIFASYITEYYISEHDQYTTFNGKRQGKVVLYDTTCYFHNGLLHGKSISDNIHLYYYNGLRNGPYHEVNRNIRFYKNYVDSELNGPFKVFKNGECIIESNYIDNMKNGLHIEGNVSSEYVNDILHGIQKKSYGNIEVHTTYYDGVRHGPTITYKNGKIIKTVYYYHNRLVKQMPSFKNKHKKTYKIDRTKKPLSGKYKKIPHIRKGKIDKNLLLT